MLDFCKFQIENQDLINRLEGLALNEFKPTNPPNRNYLSYGMYDNKIRLDFRKVKEYNEVVGFRSVDLCISPHYHFNNYRHNGNDFAPHQCINAIKEILTELGIKENEYNDLKPINIEFGLNVIPTMDIKNLINGLYFHKKTKFNRGSGITEYFKITNSTAFKQIKAYAKGLQFSDYPEYGINLNTFRFEVRSKQFKNIVKYGIHTLNNLLKMDTYKRLGNELLNEWEQILLINLEPNKCKGNTIITNVKKKDFWEKIIGGENRNKFSRYKKKYYSILDKKDNLHTQIKGQILDKINSFLSGAYSTHETPMNIRKVDFENNPLQLIKVEYAPLEENKGLKYRVCLVTGLDISMQKKNSSNLSIEGLKFYKENEPKIYQELELKYLTPKKKNKDDVSKLYYMAHNIRNARYNEQNNRKEFEKRNYNKQQLQFNF
jgi:hypothetical protein